MIPQSRPDLREEDFDYVRDILSSRHVAKGPFVDRFQEELGRATGAASTFAVASGTAALHLSLVALGVRRGDEVVVPSYVCAAVLYAIDYVGARPVLVDVDPATLNPPVALVARRLSRKSKAIITTHTFGFPSAVDELVGLGVPVIEDCAQALGATLAGRPVGSYGALTVCSFYATKVICSGEGGAVGTNDRRLAARLRDLTTPDQQRIYRVRYNYKMSDLAAGLGLRQIGRLPAMIARRRSIAARYRAALGGDRVKLQEALPGAEPIHYRFIVRHPRAAAVIRKARADGVWCDRPVFRPLHLYLGIRGRGAFAGTDEAWRTALSIPLYPALTDLEVDKIVETMQSALA